MIAAEAPSSGEIIDMFIEQELRMMVCSGALVAASERKNRGWCVQFAGGDPEDISRWNALMLAHGWHLGTKHYHNYRQAQRRLAELMEEDETE